MPLGFLSGTFYSVDRLPGTRRLLSHANSVFYFVEAMRAGLLGHYDLPVPVSLTVVVGLAVALSSWSLALFRSATQLKP